jgi:hypothetical protein
VSWVRRTPYRDELQLTERKRDQSSCVVEVGCISCERVVAQMVVQMRWDETWAPMPWRGWRRRGMLGLTWLFREPDAVVDIVGETQLQRPVTTHCDSVQRAGWAFFNHSIGTVMQKQRRELSSGVSAERRWHPLGRHRVRGEGHPRIINGTGKSLDSCAVLCQAHCPTWKKGCCPSHRGERKGKRALPRVRARAGSSFGPL